MDREKEIEEIEKIIEDNAYTYDYIWTVFGTSSAAEKLIDAGYRKADEVRKETAKEILQMLVGRTLVNKEVDGYWFWTITADDVRFIAEKYGVEVE